MTDLPASPFRLEPAERVLVHIETDDGHLLVTEDRIATSQGERVMLDVPLGSLRRIQLDIERRRPATFVIVPDMPSSAPQVVPISPAHYQLVCDASAHIGRVLDGLD